MTLLRYLQWKGGFPHQCGLLVSVVLSQTIAQVNKETHAWPMLWEVRITTHSKGQEQHSQDSCRNKQALTTVCLQQQHVCVARILS